MGPKYMPGNLQWEERALFRVYSMPRLPDLCCLNEQLCCYSSVVLVTLQSLNTVEPVYNCHRDGLLIEVGIALVDGLFLLAGI